MHDHATISFKTNGNWSHNYFSDFKKSDRISFAIYENEEKYDSVNNLLSFQLCRIDLFSNSWFRLTIPPIWNRAPCTVSIHTLTPSVTKTKDRIFRFIESALRCLFSKSFVYISWAAFAPRRITIKYRCRFSSTFVILFAGVWVRDSVFTCSRILFMVCF